MRVGERNRVPSPDLDRTRGNARNDRFTTLELLDIDIEPGFLEEAELLRVVRVGLRLERADGDVNNRLVLRVRRSAEREDERDYEGVTSRRGTCPGPTTGVSLEDLMRF